MKKRTLGQLTEITPQRYFPLPSGIQRRRKTIAAYAVILILLLFFTQAGIAATGTVNYNTVYQQIEGFGAAAVYDPTYLPSHSQKETLYDLMFRDLGLDILRIRNTYGYSDGPATMNATKTIVAAAKLPGRNPNLITELVPWSPQASLKSNNNINGGTLAKSGGAYVYAAYGQWWADSMDEWASGTNGFIPDYISMQNEPDWEPSYDGCKFLATESSSYAGYDQAFEAFYNAVYARMGSNTPKIIAPETMGFGNSESYIDALNARGQMDHIFAFSHHLYSDGSFDNPDGMIAGMEDYAANYGDYYNKPLIMTEFVENGQTPDFDMAVKMAWHMHNTIVHEGTISWYWWTLFRSSTASTGGMININNSTGTYEIRDLYYFFKHYAYLTDPNWYVVDATTNPSDNLRMTAFKSPTGDKLTVVLLNKSSSSDNITLTLDGCTAISSQVYRSSSSEHWVSLGSFSNPLTLPALSITTISFTITVGPQQTLTTSSTTGGNVTTPGEGNFNYAQDTNATIVATADSYYHFVDWTGTAVTAGKVENTTSASTKVFMDANYTVVANFEANPPDTTPPTPNPLVWASVPTATGSSTIVMTATTATDANSPPVQYYFECTNHGEANSTWQTSPTYLASGLTPNTLYSFKVKARDSYLTPNETGYSDVASATTFMPSTDVNLIGIWTTGTTHAKVSGSNRALIFIAHGELSGSDMNLASVTYGGQPMTKIIERNAGSGTGYRGYVAAFILNEAGITAADTSGTFASSWRTTPESASYASAFFDNANQTTSVGATDSNAITSSTPATIITDPLATNDGDMVILGATCGNNGSYTLNNGFTEGSDQSVGTNGHTGATGRKAATGVPETPSATYSTSPNRQVIIGFVIKAMAAVINDPPAAPANLTATAGNGIITLDWGDNNETDLLGYNVYRSTTSGSGYGKINASIISESNYIDSSVTNGTPYFYVVTAVDDANNESGYSNEATATPAYQDCEDVQNAGHGLESDLNHNCYVDFGDLDVLVAHWLNPDCVAPDNCGGADFEPADGTVDFFDLNQLAQQWMQCNDPEQTDCIFNW